MDQCAGWYLKMFWTHKSPRLVVFRDWKLAVARGVCLVGVLVYFVLYELVLEQNYYDHGRVLGYADASAVSMARGSASQQYCCTGGACPAATTSLECVEWDLERTATWGGSNMFVTTRVAISESDAASWSCLLNATQPGNCNGLTQGTQKDYYVLNPESVQVRLGYATMENGAKEPKVSVESALETTEVDEESGSAFSVGDILAAAGVSSLDTESWSGSTWRYTGIDLAVMVDSGDGTGFKVARLTWDAPQGLSSWRTKYDSVTSTLVAEQWKRHGVRLHIFVDSARHFSFAELVRTVAASGVLLWVSFWLIDWLLIPLLPGASIYRRYRFLLTRNFGRIRHVQDISTKQYTLGQDWDWDGSSSSSSEDDNRIPRGPRGSRRGRLPGGVNFVQRVTTCSTDVTQTHSSLQSGGIHLVFDSIE
eukprot:Hpha_TRINITY_DN16000_c3_g1::TRINITY_DN16000_c3_g1_i1::g.120198::m.120198/K05216/P2RX2; P2X purinoceptor 2